MDGHVGSTPRATRPADLRVSNIAAEARAKIVYERLMNLTGGSANRESSRSAFLMTREIAHQKSFKEEALYAIDGNFPPGKRPGVPDFENTATFDMSQGGRRRSAARGTRGRSGTTCPIATSRPPWMAEDGSATVAARSQGQDRAKSPRRAYEVAAGCRSDDRRRSWKQGRRRFGGVEGSAAAWPPAAAPSPPNVGAGEQ